MITVVRTNSDDKNFKQLTQELDSDLKIRDGDNYLFYAQLNKIGSIPNAVVVYEEGKPIGCGAVRKYSTVAMEVKRMYVIPGKRGQGIAVKILQELELWCTQLGYKKCILETGKNQPEAIRLYEKTNYKQIPNFGHYENSENSVCFEKELTA